MLRRRTGHVLPLDRPPRGRRPGRRSPWRDLRDALRTSIAPRRVELKAVVAAQQPLREVMAALGVDVHSLRRRTVYFLDTPGLDLFRRGVFVRVRRGADAADVVVKVRRPDPVVLPSRSRTFPSLTVEVDALPDAVAWTAAVPARVRRRALRSVAGTGRKAGRLLSREQRRLLQSLAPGVAPHDLVLLGPVDTFRGRTDRLGRKASVDVWQLPCGRRFVEVSTKCGPDAAPRTAVATATALARCGVVLDGEQQLKTDAAFAHLVEGSLPKAG